MDTTHYHTWAQLPAGDSGDTYDVLKRRLADELARKVANGSAQALDPENNLVVYGSERAFPNHAFDATAVSYHAYRHGGVAYVYSSYIFTPSDKDANG